MYYHLSTVLPPTHNGSHSLAVLKRLLKVQCFRNIQDPSLPMPQNLSSLLVALLEVFQLLYSGVFQQVLVEMFLSYPQITRHNMHCSTCPFALLHRKVTINFRLQCSNKLFFYIMFCLEIQMEDGRAISQHKPLCKHVTKIGHVLYVCFTNSLHFLLQVLPGASIKTAGR